MMDLGTGIFAHCVGSQRMSVSSFLGSARFGPQDGGHAFQMANALSGLLSSTVSR